jgi:predicted  nucleic acid-binding Zn-ribbon protein
MQVRCPHCSQVFASERRGRQFCPACGGEIFVPETAAGEGEAAAGASGAPPPAGSAPTGADGGNPEGAARFRLRTW